MKAIFTVIIGLILCPITDKTVIKLEGKPELFTTDKLGNMFVYRDNLLNKISVEGKVIGQYSLLESGKLHSMDASDPMQVLLFYKDFNQLVIIDNKLNQIGTPFYFDLVNLSSVTAVCKSKQFAIWIFDEYEEKLIRYGFNPKGTLLTINLDKYKEELGNVEYMLESGNEIYMKGKNNFIWIFDEFGTLLNKLKIETENEFQVKNNKIVYSFKNKIFWHDLISDERDSLKIDNFDKFTRVRVESNSIYILNNDSITILPIDKLK